MTLRRLWAGIPLAVLVAVLAHVVGFGSSHAPGGENAAGLGVALLTGLVLLLARGFFAGAAGAAGAGNAATPTARRRTASAIGLAALAAGAFAAIEVVEGHLSWPGSLRALAAMLPLAVAVAAMARHARHAVARAGRAFAGTARGRENTGHAVFIACVSRRADARTAARRRAGPGRAPPRFA